MKQNAAKEGLTLEIVEFSDYIQPNAALAAGDLQANSYQHQPFLNAQIKARGYDIVPVGKTALFPIAFYSKRYKTLAEVPAGATVALPNDPSNEARTLLLLESAGLVKLKPGAGVTATPVDIIDNPKKFKFIELEAPQLARALQDVDLGAINTNYAIEAKLNPKRDALLLEGRSPVHLRDRGAAAGCGQAMGEDPRGRLPAGQCPRLHRQDLQRRRPRRLVSPCRGGGRGSTPSPVNLPRRPPRHHRAAGRAAPERRGRG